MIFNFCVYLTTYLGNLLPKYYIGSTNIKNIQSCKYFGSVKYKKWSSIFKSERKNNPHLFTVKILSMHETREEAWTEELRVQRLHDVVKSSEYFNESYATINGMFGRDVSGKNNPMYGRKQSQKCINLMIENNPAKRTDVKIKLSTLAKLRPKKEKIIIIKLKKDRKVSEETKLKISSKLKGISKNKGKKSWNEGLSKYNSTMNHIIEYLKSNDFLYRSDISTIFSFSKIEIKKSLSRLIQNNQIQNINPPGVAGKYILKIYKTT